MTAKHVCSVDGCEKAGRASGTGTLCNHHWWELSGRARTGAQRKGSEEHRLSWREIYIDRFGEPHWTPERIIAEIQKWALSHDGPPGVRDWSEPRRGSERSGFVRRRDHPSAGHVINSFGSWNAAIEAAGFTPRPQGGPRLTVCRAGLHALTVDNVSLKPNGKRSCRACLNAAKRRWDAAKRAEKRRAAGLPPLAPGFCRAGLHELTDDNVRVIANGVRLCRACLNAKQRRWYHESQAAKAAAK